MVRTLAPLAAALLAAAAAPQDRWAREAETRLHLSLSRDGREGVRLERMVVADAMGDEGMRTVPVRLEAGREYVIAAVCDDECADLDLRVMDARGAALAADEDDAPRPLIDFAPERAGEYTLRASMVSCRRTVCGYAVAVFVADAAGE